MNTKNNSNKRLHKNSLWFTIVELIVAITIVGILWTIGFVSVSGYVESSRDSVRLTDMNAMYGQLNIFLGENGVLPMPEKHTTIHLSGTTMAYQWYMSQSIQNSIKFAGDSKDPKDSVYYTYSVDIRKQQAQLMSYFEDYDVTKLAQMPSLVPQAFAASGTIDYSTRKVGVVGKNICVFVNPRIFSPVQTTNTGVLDIANTNGIYTMYCDNTTNITGTWAALQTAFVSNSSTIFACTNTTYSDYGACQPNSTQTRTVTNIWPNGCTVSNPVLTQACYFFPPTCHDATITNAQAIAHKSDIYNNISDYLGCTISDYTGGSWAIIAGTTTWSTILVAGLATDDDQYQWMWWNWAFISAFGFAVSLTDGLLNTNEIVDRLTLPPAEYPSEGRAAPLCYGKSTIPGVWYLPAKDELNAFYTNLKTQSRGGFSSDHYWTSTDVGWQDVWEQNFSDGVQWHDLWTWPYYGNKTSPNKVRCASRF